MIDLRTIQKALKNLWVGVRTFDDASLANEIAVFKSFKEFLITRIGNVCTDSVIETISSESDHLKACQIAAISLRYALNVRVALVTDKEVEFAVQLMIQNESLMSGL